MDTKIITENNIKEYEGVIPADVAENIPRNTFCGICVHNEDENVAAAMVFELKNSRDVNKDTTSRISWFTAEDSDSGEMLFLQYGTMMKYEEPKKSLVELKKEGSGFSSGILRNTGFSLSEKESEEVFVTVKDFSELSILRKTKVPPYVIPIGTLSERDFRRGLLNCIFHTTRELTEDLGALPMKWFDADLSCCIETDGRINGYLLIHELPSGSLQVELLSAYGPDAKADLIHMIRFSILRAVRLYPLDTKVIIPRHDDNSRKLTSYFFPEAKGELCVYGERDERKPEAAP